MKEKAEELFLKAEKKLHAASTELFRPEEDVVAYSVCKNVQFAVEHYLKGYLLKNKIDPSGHYTIESLYNHCAALDPKFGEVDMTHFECKVHPLDSKYCDNHSTASGCFEVAEKLSTFLKRSGMNRVVLNEGK